MPKRESFEPYPERPEVSGSPTTEDLLALDQWTRRVRAAQEMPLDLDGPFIGEGTRAPDPE